MLPRILFLLVLCCVVVRSTSAQERVKLHIPTAEEETESIWRTIQDIEMLEKHGYQISLPPGEFIERLTAKSKQHTLTEQDYLSLQNFVKAQVYREANYREGADRIRENLPLIQSMLEELRKTNYSWGFRHFDQYQITLTLYGTGGSYDPEGGSIVIFTTVTGKFKQYENPAYTLIHEVVHLGTEESIVGKFAVPHALKERIVDLFVSLHFQDQLPGYRIQEMGETRIDAFLQQKKDLEKLDQFVSEIMVQE